VNSAISPGATVVENFVRLVPLTSRCTVRTFAVVVEVLRNEQFITLRWVEADGAATTVVVVAEEIAPALLPGVKAVVVLSVHEQS
jgi:hypothetical protein